VSPRVNGLWNGTDGKPVPEPPQPNKEPEYWQKMKKWKPTPTKKKT
jgi:hypothetical protein